MLIICLIIISISFSQIIQNSEKIKNIDLFIGEEQVIDQFQDFGLILDSNLTYGSSIQPCYIKNQRLIARNAQDSIIPIIPQYQETYFREQFSYGTFNSKFPQIVNMVHINQGVVVLTNEAKIFHLKFEDDEFKIQSQHTLNIDIGMLQYPVFMEHFQNNDEILIILNGSTLLLQLKMEEVNVFGDIQQIFDVFQTQLITSFACANNLIFVASGQKGLSIYEVRGKRLESIPNLITATNIQDVKVFSEFDIYFIFVLDQSTGIKLNIYNAKTTLFNEDSKFGTIPYPGYIMDIYRNTLIVIQQKSFESVAYDIHLNFTDHSWSLVNSYRVQKDVRDIDITNQYAIILGSNGHEVIFHSISHDFKQGSIKTQIIIPSLEKLQFLSWDLRLKQTNQLNLGYSNFIFGISQHRFFYSQIIIIPNKIVCYTDQKFEQFEMIYNQNSTQCSAKVEDDFKSECQFAQKYMVQLVYPWLTSDQSFLLYGMVIGIILAFIILIGVLVYQYLQYDKYVYNYQVDSTAFNSDIVPKSNEVTIQNYDSPTKFMQLASSTLQFKVHEAK